MIIFLLIVIAVILLAIYASQTAPARAEKRARRKQLAAEGRKEFIDSIANRPAKGGWIVLIVGAVMMAAAIAALNDIDKWSIVRWTTGLGVLAILIVNLFYDRDGLLDMADVKLENISRIKWASYSKLQQEQFVGCVLAAVSKAAGFELYVFGSNAANDYRIWLENRLSSISVDDGAQPAGCLLDVLAENSKGSEGILNGIGKVRAVLTAQNPLIDQSTKPDTKVSTTTAS